MSLFNYSIIQDTIKNNTFELNYDFLNLSTNILYTVIFLIGIIANIIVMYVLLSTLCFNQNRESNNMTQLAENQHNGTQSTLKKKHNSSFRSRSTNSSFRQKNMPTETKQNEFEPEIQLKKSLIKKQNTTNYNPENNLPSSPVISLNYDEKLTKFDLFCFYLKLFFREKLNVTNFYLLNLAFSDFFYMLTIPILLCTIYYGQWIFNNHFCKLYLASCYVFQCSSVFILIVLSVDRYLSVKYPFKVSAFRKPTSARIIIASLWIFSFILYSPVFYFSQIIEYTNPACSIDWPTDLDTNIFGNSKLLKRLFAMYNLFFIYTFLFNYLVPVIIIIILYTKILCLLHKKNLTNLKKSKKKTRVTRMVLAIIVCYVICWTPYWFSQLFNYTVHNYKGILNEDREEELNEETILHHKILTIMSHFGQVIAYMSSALNPIIYSYMSEAFKTNLKYSAATCCCYKITENLESDGINEFEVGKTYSKKFNNRSKHFSFKKDENLEKKIVKTQAMLPEANEIDNFQSNEQVLNEKKTIKSCLDISGPKKQLSFKFFTEKENGEFLNSSAKKSKINPRKDSITTFIYKNKKSNFAFNINFHPLYTKNSLIKKKISAINKQVLKSKKIGIHEKFEKIDSVNEINRDDVALQENT